MTALIDRFNRMSLWVADCVLERNRPEERALLIDIFINTAQVEKFKIFTATNFKVI